MSKSKKGISTLNRPLYRDIDTCRDKSIEVHLSKNTSRKKLEEIVGVSDADKLERLAKFILKLYAVE